MPPGFFQRKKELSDLAYAIFKFFWRQVWVPFHVEVPAVQLDNCPIFYLTKDLGDRLISVALGNQRTHPLEPGLTNGTAKGLLWKEEPSAIALWLFCD